MGIFEGFGHVAFKVNDLDRSVDFYNKIGFPEMLRLLDAEGKPWIVYHRISEKLYLELFPGGDGGPAPDPARTGMNHFCLTVANADEAERKLAAAGIALSRPRKTVRHRRQLGHVDRGSRRQSDRDPGNGAAMHPVRSGAQPGDGRAVACADRLLIGPPGRV